MLKLFGKASNSEIDEFSRDLARRVADRLPVSSSTGTLDKKQARVLSKALQDVYDRARDFRVEKRLGIYGRARLGNTFKWELLEQGYDRDFVDEATKGLVIKIGKR